MTAQEIKPNFEEKGELIKEHFILKTEILAKMERTRMESSTGNGFLMARRVKGQPWPLTGKDKKRAHGFLVGRSFNSGKL